jgi:hypothetical protein
MNRSTSIPRTVAACLALAGATVLPVAWVFTASAGEAQWLWALEMRSQALNELYDLGDRAPESGWLRALEVRSRALNGVHGVS